jgi:hypothetical protein
MIVFLLIGAPMMNLGDGESQIVEFSPGFPQTPPWDHPRIEISVFPTGGNLAAIRRQILPFFRFAVHPHSARAEGCSRCAMVG